MLWLSNVIPFAKTKWICLYILRADDKMLLLLLSLFLSLWCFVILVASFILDESHTHKNFLLNARSQGVHVPITAIFFLLYAPRTTQNILSTFNWLPFGCFIFILFIFICYGVLSKLFRVWLRANTVSFICLLEKEKNFTKFPINTIHSDE